MLMDEVAEASCLRRLPDFFIISYPLDQSSDYAKNNHLET